ncbi:pentapeptide repeat-containing protein [Embleya sp. NPDC001921]
MTLPAWPHCTREALPPSDSVPCPGARVPGRDRCLAHLEAAERAAYLATLGPGVAIDHRGTTFDDDLLWPLLYRFEEADHARFRLGSARFDHATFTDDPWLAGVAFADVAFTGASFLDDAWFGNASFGGETRFDGVMFGGDASFICASFVGKTRFDGATFASAARFGDCEFIGDARFDGATFAASADFGIAVFAAGARFDGASFAAGPDFDPMEDTLNARWAWMDSGEHPPWADPR